MAQFCRQFIKDLNLILVPLYNLTKAMVDFCWSQECQIAFENVKSLLIEPPVLISPSDKSDFILETDASDFGIGYCLKVYEKNQEFIVGYGSSKFSESELKWNVVEKEAHAILEAIIKNRHFLLGKKIIIKTDSQVLTYLHVKREPKNKKILNWALQLSEYDYDLVHIPSKLNGISDCLSRIHPICVIDDVQFVFDNDKLISEQNKNNEI